MPLGNGMFSIPCRQHSVTCERRYLRLSLVIILKHAASASCAEVGEDTGLYDEREDAVRRATELMVSCLKPDPDVNLDVVDAR